MTIDEAKAAEVRRLFFAEHWKVGTIVTQLSLHHEVVERVLGLRARPLPAAAPAIGKEPRAPVPLRGFEGFIAETLAQYPGCGPCVSTTCSLSAATWAACAASGGTSAACVRRPRARSSSAVARIVVSVSDVGQVGAAGRRGSWRRRSRACSPGAGAQGSKARLAFQE